MDVVEQQPRGYAAPTRKKAKMGKIQGDEVRNFYLFISPWLIGFAAFVAFPILISLYLSFTDYNVVSAPVFTGGANITRLMNDPIFWKSLTNTAIYTLLHIPLSLVISLCLALLISRPIRGVSAFRAIYYLPSILPIVSTSLMWVWIFNLKWGVLNTFLSALGLDPIPWLGTEFWAKPALVLMSMWWTGGNMIIFLAGLKDVPRELYEAAEVDGASAWVSFWRITLPLISPTILFTVITGIIGSFQVFAQAQLMTQGGPQDATMFMVLYLYNNAFRFLRMGYASTLAWALFLVVLILTILVLKASSRQVYYEYDEKK